MHLSAIIVSFHPTGSIFSGIFHLIRVFDPEESNRTWLGIAGDLLP
jgi:hypothetical protein